MKLHFAILHVGASRMDVVAEDVGGERRKVVYRWREREQGDIPPSTWRTTVYGELGWQDEQRKRAF